MNQQFAADLGHDDWAFDANMRFHLGIVETAKNPLLSEIMGAILTATVEVYALARQQSLSSAANLALFVSEHEQIIEAIAQQQFELAAKLLTNHINDARKRVERAI